MTPVQENAWLAWSAEVSGKLRDLEERMGFAEQMRRDMWDLIFRQSWLIARLCGVPEENLAAEKENVSRLLDEAAQATGHPLPPHQPR